MNKPKSNIKGNPVRDQFQTPPCALDILLPFIPEYVHTVWESAAGQGFLADALYGEGYTVELSDVLQGVNYFEYEPTDYQMQITNPPFSLKYAWLKRAYALGRPFALLMPSDVLHSRTAQMMFKERGVTILLPERRINFKPPVKDWTGSSAQFHSSWYLGNIEDHNRGIVRGIEIIPVDYTPLKGDALIAKLKENAEYRSGE